jgi:Uma2 family endonuclease
MYCISRLHLNILIKDYSYYLQKKISDHIEKIGLGEVFIAPVDVYFIDKLSAVQPDLIYVSNENKTIMGDDGYFYGAPDLIVEVL